MALWQVSGGTPHEETLRVGGVGLGEFARVKLSMIQSLDDYEATGTYDYDHEYDIMSVAVNMYGGEGFFDAFPFQSTSAGEIHTHPA